jgi:FixJ family two-component response regulator
MTEMPGGEISGHEIFVVEDEAPVREALKIILSVAGYQVTFFADGASLLAVAHARSPACIILDVHIPGKSGLDILKELNAEGYPAPIFIMSGRGDIPMAVDAIKNGAHDFIEKPFRGNEIVARIKDAIEAHRRRRNGAETFSGLPLHFPGREPLSRREREVLAQIATGASSKEAGRALGISPRTIEAHRAHIMEKLGARNAADLMRIVLRDGHSLN